MMAWLVLPGGQYLPMDVRTDLLTDAATEIEDLRRARDELGEIRVESKRHVNESRKARHLRSTNLHLVRSNIV